MRPVSVDEQAPLWGASTHSTYRRGCLHHQRCPCSGSLCRSDPETSTGHALVQSKDSKEGCGGANRPPTFKVSHNLRMPINGLGERAAITTAAP
jgi:hypothetical protein